MIMFDKVVVISDKDSGHSGSGVIIESEAISTPTFVNDEIENIDVIYILK